MAWISGPRIAEIKVNHHARQFGKSKYGLSRIYKVLLDLLVVKTVASFTARPLLWFSMLSIPLLIGGLLTTGYALSAAFWGGEALSLPIAGTGLIFLAGAVILLSSGALAEVVYNLGDMRESDFARLTQRVTSTANIQP
jgi:hypothetical protein